MFPPIRALSSQGFAIAETGLLLLAWQRGFNVSAPRRNPLAWNATRLHGVAGGDHKKECLPTRITNCFRILTARYKRMPWGAMGRLRRPHQAFALPAAPRFDGRCAGAKAFSTACCYVRETLCRMLAARMHGGFLALLVMDRMAHSLLSLCELRRTFFTGANGPKHSNYAAGIPVRFWDNEHNSGGRCAQAAELRRSRREHRTSPVDRGGSSFAQVWSAIHVVRPG
ncbi:hypothetical protein RSgd_1065 [Ralstonia solanacearum]